MRTSSKLPFFMEGLIASLIGIIAGVLLVTIDGAKLTSILFIIIGVLIVLFNILPFIETIRNLKYKTSVAVSQFFSSLAVIVVGFLLIFFQKTVTIAVGILLIVFALMNIVLARSNWLEELRTQLPLLIIAALLLIFGIGGIVDILLTVIGWVLIVFSSVYLILLLVEKIRKE